MKKGYLLISGFIISMLVSCSGRTNSQGEEPLVKVGEKYLYRSDLPVVSGSGISAADSSHMQNTFIEKWVKSQLLLQKAELNLPEADQDVNEQLEEYRKSILIYKYQQMLLKQELDTVVTKEQIEEYYGTHSGGFVLNKPVVRGLFMQILRPAPDLDKVRGWCRSENPESLKKLEDYCNQYAAKYEFAPDGWIPFDRIQSVIPAKTGFGEWILRAYKLYESQDTTSVYMLAIKDYRLAGSVSPVELVENNIRNILLNKRKIEFLSTIESDLYNNAVSRNQVEYYNK
jgi:hypothetical protein